jgi:uncharacterized membrane protein
METTWNDLGQLGAIATIRTVLNYYLQKDIDHYGGTEVRAEGVRERKAA